MRDPSFEAHAMDLCAQARAVHQHLHAELCALRASAIYSHKLHKQWSRFEDELLARLRAEEELLMPAFELAGGEQAARLRSDHQRIRELVLHLDRTFEAHMLDDQALTQLERLIKHNRGLAEQSILPWAQHCMPARNRREFRARLRSSEVPRGVQPVLG